MTDSDIRTAVQADINRLIKREEVVKFEIIRQAKEIDLVFHKGLEYSEADLKHGLMADADGYLACGIGLDIQTARDVGRSAFRISILF